MKNRKFTASVYVSMGFPRTAGPLRKRFLLSAVTAVLLIVALPVTASSTNWGSSGTPGIGGTTNGVWFTPNSSWHVGLRELTSTYSTAVTQSVLNDYGPTALDVSVATASSCGQGSWDLCAFDSNYGNNGLAGWNQCAGSTSGSHPNQVCDLGFIKLNLYFSGPPPETRSCHELGHSVGLRHGAPAPAGSCMKSESGDLTQHDRDHIDGRYS